MSLMVGESESNAHVTVIGPRPSLVGDAPHPEHVGCVVSQVQVGAHMKNQSLRAYRVWFMGVDPFIRLFQSQF